MWTPPFTSIGPICLGRIAHRIPRGLGLMISESNEVGVKWRKGARRCWWAVQSWWGELFAGNAMLHGKEESVTWQFGAVQGPLRKWKTFHDLLDVWEPRGNLVANCCLHCTCFNPSLHLPLIYHLYKQQQGAAGVGGTDRKQTQFDPLHMPHQKMLKITYSFSPFVITRFYQTTLRAGDSNLGEPNDLHCTLKRNLLHRTKGPLT